MYGDVVGVGEMNFLNRCKIPAIVDSIDIHEIMNTDGIANVTLRLLVSSKMVGDLLKNRGPHIWIEFEAKLD